jgi:hypothetical protein
VIVTTGVVVLVSAGLGAGRGTALAEARIMFTHVRLIPCMVRDSFERVATLFLHTGSPAPALPVATGPVGTTVATSSGPIATQAVASEAAANLPVERSNAVVRGVRGIVEPVRDGFEQAIQGPAEIADEIKDSRLMMQIGMGLGFVYAAFLSVWFWATRMRGNLKG